MLSAEGFLWGPPAAVPGPNSFERCIGLLPPTIFVARFRLTLSNRWTESVMP